MNARKLLISGLLTLAAVALLLVPTLRGQGMGSNDGDADDDTEDPKMEVETMTVSYKAGDIECEGYLARPKLGDTGKQKPADGPAVLVIHDWMGMSDVLRKKVEQVASLGYVAFGADIYGKGVRPASPEDAGKQAGKYKGDIKLFRIRLQAGLDALLAQPRVDKKKIAAIGFCFGGTGVLELARTGAEIDGVVSFHGGLASANVDDAKNIKCKVLVLHGADDPFVPEKEVVAFVKEMRGTQVDWQLHMYSGAVHAFTNPAAGNDNSKGAAYNKLADERSWDDMEQFFDEIFE